jgi:hypothetical protein
MEMTFLLFFFLIIGLLIFLYIQFVEKPKEREEENRKELWIRNNKEFINTQTHLKGILDNLYEVLPPCKKCDSTLFQLWELNNKEIRIRCKSCKKVHLYPFEIRIKSGDSVMSFVDLVDKYIRLVQFSFNEGNSPLGNHLRSYLKWDFSSLRSGTILYRGITFYTNPNYEPPEETEDVLSERSRRIPQSVMDKVWNRDKGSCVTCGSKKNLEFDHIIPFSKGGSNTYRNIQLLCENCNRQKSDKLG